MGGTHGSLSKAGRTRDTVNKGRHSVVVKTHNKKKAHPMVKNRRRYRERVLLKRRVGQQEW